MTSKPTRRSEFGIAIICALPVEYDAVYFLADEVWDSSYYGRNAGDSNFYTTCRLGQHNCVIVLLPNVGTSSSSGAIARLKMTFNQTHTVFLVGICGGLPHTPEGRIFLGDVIIGDEITPRDYGKMHPEGFQHTPKIGYGFGNYDANIRGFLATLKTSPMKKRLEGIVISCLGQFQQAADQDASKLAFQYPGSSRDRLFGAEYRHRHRSTCPDCDDLESRGACAEAVDRDCMSLGCDVSHVQTRADEEELEAEAGTPQVHCPKVHFGLFASADTVVKSAKYRDMLGQKHKAIGYEMEAAGLMNEGPCIVIKGVADYADLHKSKEWQPYAAAAAASTFKGVLELFNPDRHQGVKRSRTQQTHHPIHHLPFARNKYFRGREASIELLRKWLFSSPQSGFQRVALHGLGGIGKSQVALEIAHWAKSEYQDDGDRDCSVLWIPVSSMALFEQACTTIVKQMACYRNSPGDAKVVLKEYFTSEASGRWLIILDNADDAKLLFGSDEDSEDYGLMDFLPQSELGSILITTRNREVAIQAATNNVIGLTEMPYSEAVSLFRSSLVDGDLLLDTDGLSTLIKLLGGIPLAITQAIAYINTTNITIQQYLRFLQDDAFNNDDNLALKSLFRTSHEAARYDSAQNSIAATWLLSFNKITATDANAGGLLLFLACIEPKAIPHALLPVAKTEQQHMRALNTLRNYSFLTLRDGVMYEMHVLVHMAVRQWAGTNVLNEAKKEALKHLAAAFPPGDAGNLHIRQSYFPHALRLIEESSHLYGDLDSESFWMVKFHLGETAVNDGRVVQAISILESVVTGLRNKGMKELLLAAEHQLARAYIDNGMAKQGLSLQQSIVQVRRELPDTHIARLVAEKDLAMILRETGRYEEAVRLFEETIMRMKLVVEADNFDLLQAQAQLGGTYLYTNSLSKSASTLEHVVEVRSKIYTQDDHLLLETQRCLLVVYGYLGQFDKMHNLSRHVLSVCQKSLSEDHPDTIRSHFQYGKASLLQGEVLEGLEQLKLCVEQYRRAFYPESHVLFMQAKLCLAEAYDSNGQIAPAVQLQESVVKTSNANLTSDEVRHIMERMVLARLYIVDGQVKEAIRMLTEEILPAAQKSLEEDNMHRLLAQTYLATAYLADGRNKGAIPLIEYVFSRWREAHPGHKHQLNAQVQLGRAYQANGRFKDAVRVMEEVVEKRTSFKETHLDRLESEYALALAYRDDGQVRKALQLLVHVVTQRRLLEKNHYKRIESENALSNMLKEAKLRDDD